jgi:hypothetical protein
MKNERIKRIRLVALPSILSSMKSFIPDLNLASAFPDSRINFSIINKASGN